MKKRYLKLMEWVVFTMIDRSTQDDHKSKVHVSAIFSNPIDAKENYIQHQPNPEVKRYMLAIEDLEEFERFYNFIQDLNEEYGEYAIHYLDQGDFSTDQEKRFRYILKIF